MRVLYELDDHVADIRGASFKPPLRCGFTNWSRADLVIKSTLALHVSEGVQIKFQLRKEIENVSS
jgi:hypothetical protein